jgi:hypothetical protein
MADSNRTGQRLLSSIRKAKAGDAPTGEPAAATPELTAASAEPGGPPARGATPRKTTAKKAPARKTAARKAAAKKVPPRPAPTSRTPAGARTRNAVTAAPYPMFATARPQPGAYPGPLTEEDPYRSPGRVWPD